MGYKGKVMPAPKPGKKADADEKTGNLAPPFPKKGTKKTPSKKTTSSY